MKSPLQSLLFLAFLLLSGSATAETRRVAIQGQIGSFHDVATHLFFPDDDIELICCQTFEDVFAQMKSDSTVIALLAIENTIAGSLLHNYELLNESGAVVVGEQRLRISHSIVCLPDEDWNDIHEVSSHPVALMQCRDFLQRHPDLKSSDADDTAGAAKNISEKNLKGHAAICSKYAAGLYGMKILEEGIETNKHNFTRFLVLSSPWQASRFSLPEESDKASISFTLTTGGAPLSDVLSVFTSNKIKLSKIQTLPILGKEWQYTFYVDVCYNNFKAFSESIDVISKMTSGLKVLGEYKEN